MADDAQQCPFSGAPETAAPVANTAAIPAHVPPDLVRDYEDVLGPNTLDDPFALTEQVRTSFPPIFFATPKYTGAMGGTGSWVCTRYEDIREVLQNTDRYSSEGIFPFQALVGESWRAVPISFDPPEHDKYRLMLNPWFSPKAITQLESQIHGIINDLIDGFAAKGECDAAYGFSRIYPVKVFMALMGFPAERFEDFLSWGLAMLHEMNNLERVKWGASSALAYLRSFIEEVKSEPPNETLTSRIVHGQVEGRPLTDDEIIGTVFFLWVGGLDTVAAASTFMFRWLALNPKLQAELRAKLDDAAYMTEAVEEFLRMHPTVNSARVAKVDHELGGVQVKAGDRMSCLIAVGNFDLAEFEEPRCFHADRATNRHLTFIAGPHRCLGSHLARRELRIALQEFLRRIPPFRMEPGADRTVVPGLIAMKHLPLVWDVVG
jgi:cytochrome P450